MLDRRIKLRHLQCFLEVARHGSMVRAADRLAVTQPAVSKTVRELEQIVGVELFDRSAREVTLTGSGALFLRYAGAGMTALIQGVESLAQDGTGGESAIRVGVLPTVAARIVPRAVQRFRRHSRAMISLESGANAGLLGRLRVGDLDLVVGRLAQPDQLTGLSFAYLYSERVSFVVRAGHPLLNESAFTLERIRDYPVIYPIDGSIIRPYVERFLIANGVAPLPDRIETVSNAFGRVFVRETDAVWIISHGVVARETEEGSLAELPVDTSDTLGPVGLTSRAGEPPPPLVQMFMDAVRDAASGIAERRSGPLVNADAE
ncbi:MAG TPA: pca operon transcription factor PcaQ [Arenicellales bacterium]|nr:pca operon transcription factor PcaQ [Arenicellales bacterium]